ncbi:isochorismatase family protein [Zavarzinia sp. CC-PAN008]|uniref:isochorismatase family protein n=1 Tax=Zavarzinia sp. CC-PAN008 TaxID=3243332 RepID=UPI003F744E51
MSTVIERPGMAQGTEIERLTHAVAQVAPIALVPLDLRQRRAGLVIVDEVNGFCTVGCGPLAPAAPNAQVSRMVTETVRLAQAFSTGGRPILAFKDSHTPGVPEPPYPPHCEIGTGQEELVPELQWLEQDAQTTLIAKDCINGFVGAIRDGRNGVVDWVNAQSLDCVLVVGICTDICVMDFVLTLLSARNHGMMPSLRDIAVLEGACATYDLPRSVAEQAGLPVTLAHPQALTHHMGLYFMASRGALLVDAVTL